MILDLLLIYKSVVLNVVLETRQESLATIGFNLKNARYHRLKNTLN